MIFRRLGKGRGTCVADYDVFEHVVELRFHRALAAILLLLLDCISIIKIID